MNNEYHHYDSPYGHRGRWFSIRGLLKLTFVIGFAIAFTIQQHRVAVLESELQELRDEQLRSSSQLQRVFADQQKLNVHQQRLTIRHNALENHVRDPPVRFEPLVMQRSQ